MPDTCLQFWGGMGLHLGKQGVAPVRSTAAWPPSAGGADEVMLGILSKIMGIAKRPVSA